MVDPVERLLTDHPVIDGHNDLLWTARELVGYDWERLDLADPEVGPGLGTHTDLARLRSGGVGAQFWSVFVPCAEPHPVTATLEQIDAGRAMIARYSDQLAFAGSAHEVEAAWASGRIACLFGAEGGHQIGGSLGVLRQLYALGVRYLTLTHERNVDWADSATDEPVLQGLSPFGVEVVHELNRLGMLVDLSHVSADVMRQVIAASAVPVIFSHSSARAICDHPRNVPDDVLQSLAGNGGVCMVTFVSRFVNTAVMQWYAETLNLAADVGITRGDHDALVAFIDQRRLDVPPPRATLDDVVAHVEHVREVAGLEHIGLGGDFDGTPWVTQGLEDVSGYPRLLEALRERHWSDADLAALTCRNILRVMRDALD